MAIGTRDESGLRSADPFLVYRLWFSVVKPEMILLYGDYSNAEDELL